MQHLRAIKCLSIQFVGLVLSLSCHAGLESDVGLIARSYPLSAVSSASFGWGQILWGDSNSPYFSYIKPELTFYLTKGYNAQNLKLRFFPVSFIELFYGVERSDNGQDFADYNCTDNICRGRFQDSYSGFITALKYLGIFTLYSMRLGAKKSLSGELGTNYFIDPDQMLRSQNNDNYTRSQWLLGYELSPEWKFSLLSLESQNLENKSKSFLKAVNLHYKYNDVIDIFYGTGIAHPSPRTQQVTHLLSIKWKLTPTLETF